MKKSVALFLVIILTVTLLGAFPVSAKSGKATLSVKTVKVVQGKTKTIQLKNAPKKVKWKVANKKIVKIVKKTGSKKNKITIKGLKVGKTKITATCAGKKYTVKVTVKKKAAKENATVKTEKKPEPVIEVTTAESSTQEAALEPTTSPTAEESTAEVTTDETVSEETTAEAASEEASVEETTEPKTFQENYDNKDIVATVVKDKITADENLTIIFTLQNFQEGQMLSYVVAPKCLEKYVNGEWIEVVNTLSGFEELAYEIHGGVGTYSVKLNRYFELEPGHYRWTHEVNWVAVPVEFDIIEADTEQ